MAPQIHPKSMKNRGCVADAFLERFWAAFGREVLSGRDAFGSHLDAIFAQKSKKWHPKKHPKIDAEKVSKIDAKRLQNDAKMDAKMIDFSYFFEKGENAPDPLFSHMKRGSGLSKTPKNLNKNRC